MRHMRVPYQDNRGLDFSRELVPGPQEVPELRPTTTMRSEFTSQITNQPKCNNRL